MAKLTVRTIQDRVCSEMGVPMRELLSARRSQQTARCRQVAMYLAVELTSASYPQVGRAFDRDHTTVLYGVRKIREALAVDHDLARVVGELTARLTSEETDHG